MEDYAVAKDYAVARKDVCAGQLLKDAYVPIKIHDLLNDNEISQEELENRGIPKSIISGGLKCRSMLFSVNESGLANDLIYTTPTNYPIDGIETKIATQSQFVIYDYVKLEPLLKYEKYGEYLTQDNLNHIFLKYITHCWWLDHHQELFGFKKVYDENIGVYMAYKGGETIPLNIHERLGLCCGDGEPHREEPDYSLIKKRK